MHIKVAALLLKHELDWFLAFSVCVCVGGGGGGGGQLFWIFSPFIQSINQSTLFKTR